MSITGTSAKDGRPNGSHRRGRNSAPFFASCDNSRLYSPFRPIFHLPSDLHSYLFAFGQSCETAACFKTDQFTRTEITNGGIDRH
jgi:hypothetical protein